MTKIDHRAIEMWDALYSLQMIADVLGVSRAGVKKYLNRHGVDTSKKKVEVACDNCGVVFLKHRCQVRNSRFHYHNQSCYGESMLSAAYQEARCVQRNARAAVKECGYLLSENEVVGFVDGDSDNLDPNNLMVFANHADHMLWHRGDRSLVKPLWSGKGGL